MSLPQGEQDAQRSHGMLPGSHERPSGPECRCGASWSVWRDCCATQVHAQEGK
jgi:hypothetical protein